MSYTSTETVSLHLVTPHPIQDHVRDQAITLSGADYTRFFGGAIDSESLLVKRRTHDRPTRTIVTLTDRNAVICASPIVPGTVVVASDSSLGTIYTENADYTISHYTATINAVESGRIEANQTLSVWYNAYSLLVAGEDYSLRAARGEIRRLATGNIADNSTVYLDYRPLSAAFDDQLVANAVTLANGMIETELDPDREFETDPNLSAAAAHRALDIICRAAASRELSARQADDKTALAWLKLADHHAARCDHLIKQFRPPFTNPQPPVGARRRP